MDETVVRGVMPNIGFESLIDDLSSVDSKGLNYQDCEVLFRVNKQSTNIADSVHVDRDDLDAGVADTTCSSTTPKHTAAQAMATTTSGKAINTTRERERRKVEKKGSL